MPPAPANQGPNPSGALHSEKEKKEQAIQVADAQKEKIKEVFKKFDRDGNGVLSRSEVHRLMKTIGGSITAAEIDKVFEQVDSNGDDTVDIEEFVEWIMSPGSQLQVQDNGDITQFDLVSVLRPLFAVYDTNHNGAVNLDEFKELHSILQGAIRQHHEDEHEVLLAQEVGAYDDVERVFHIADDDNNGTVTLEEFVNWQREAVEKAGISKARFVELVTKLSALLLSLFTIEGSSEPNIVRRKGMKDALESATAPLKDQISGLAMELYAGDESDAKEKKTPWERLPPHICKQTLLRTHMKTPVPTYNVDEINFCVFPCIPEMERESATQRRRHVNQCRWFAKVVRRVHYKAREAVVEVEGVTQKGKSKAKAKGKSQGKAKAKAKATDQAPNCTEDSITLPSVPKKGRVDATTHYYVYEDTNDGFWQWDPVKDGKEYVESFDHLGPEFKFLAVLLTEIDFSTHCSWKQLENVFDTAINFEVVTEAQYQSFRDSMNAYGSYALGKSYKEISSLSDDKRLMLVERYLVDEFNMMVPETMNVLMQCGVIAPHHIWEDREDPLWREAKPPEMMSRRDSGSKTSTRGGSKAPSGREKRGSIIDQVSN